MNLLVVDDEPLIHISIETLIKKCCSDVVVFHAYNGHEMLRLLTEHHIALAYVDIKMPGISGLEALRQAKELSASTHYYIMTGFDEFEYAKQAIKLRVDDYLMKPLDLKTIRETIQDTLAQLTRSLEEKKDVLRNWLESILNHRDSRPSQLDVTHCALLLVTIDTCDHDYDVFLQPLLGYHHHIVSVPSREGLLILIFAERFEQVHSIIKFVSLLNHPEGITCFATPVSRGLSELKHSVFPLFDHSSLRVLLGLQKFYYLNLLTDKYQALLEFARSCIRWQGYYRDSAYTDYSNQSELIYHQFQRQTELHRYQEAFLSYVNTVLGFSSQAPKSPEAVKLLFSQSARGLLSVPTADSKVQILLQFIQEHYTENISITELSNQFGLSANHLSGLLKGALGLKYTDYVTLLRLNHAKELLVSTPLSIKEVTAACGYYSQSHFTKIFSDHEGCTPLEYRKNKG